MRTTRILVAVTDAEAETEVRRALAAAGMQAVCTCDPRAINEEMRRVALAVVDEQTAAHVAAERSMTGAPLGIILVAGPGEDIDWKFAVKIGALDALNIPAQTEDLITLVASIREPIAEAPASSGRVIAITSPVGGSGCSTLAVACAIELAHDTPEGVVLVDADPRAGGLDLLVGIENQPGLRWEDLPDDAFGPGHVAQLPSTAQGVAVLTWTRSNTPRAVQGVDDRMLAAVLAATGERTVIVDVPSLAPWRAAVDHVADVTVVVLPPEARAVASCQRFLLEIPTQVQMITHPRGWSGLSDAEVEDILGTPVAHHWPFDRKVGRQAELTGLSRALPRSLRAVARKVVA